MPRFDVYGRMIVEVVREGDAWAAYEVGRDGKRRRLVDVPLPADLDERDLVRHLEDVFHEHGAPGRELRRID